MTRILNKQGQDVTEQVLEYIQQAIDGLIYAHEMVRKIEEATGDKIEGCQEII